MQMTIANPAGPFVACLLLAQLFWLKRCVGSGFAWGACGTEGRFSRARPRWPACASTTRGVGGCAGLTARWAELAAGTLAQLKHVWGQEEGWGVSWPAACCQRGTHHVTVCVLFGGVFSFVVVINSISPLGERAQKVLREV